MSDLLDAWQRYALVLDEQLAVLAGADPDLGRFEELSRRRDHVAAEIDAMPVNAAALQGPRAEAYRLQLVHCRNLDRAILARLAEHRKGTAGALRDTEARAGGQARYLATARGGGSRRHVVDLTS